MKAIISLSNGGYSFAGFTMSRGNDHKDVWVVKIDENGNVKWDRTFGDLELMVCTP